ncbi:MAG: hypothetical protein AAFP99_05060 [Pseudomonadota bacterium]
MADARIEAHVAKVLAIVDALNVSRFVVTGGPKSRAFAVASREACAHYIRTMLQEGFCCSTIVHRAWLKATLLIEIWEADDPEPTLTGVPDTLLVWRET